MKNLKRSLALVLAVVLCFGVLAIGASAFTDDADITYVDAVKLLTDLGVLNGYKNADGTYTFIPTAPITRAEFAKVVCFVMNGGTEPILGDVSETSFTDTRGHWAAKYIEYLVALGYVSGHGDGTYGPEEVITGQQAAKLMLTALGYDATVEGLVGATWGFRTDILANQTGLYASLAKGFNSAAVLTREQAAQIVFNALNVQLRAYNALGKVYVDPAADTLFQFYFNADVAEGVLIANEHGNVLTVDGATSPGSSEILEWGVALPTAFTTGSAPELLGQSVRLLYCNTTSLGVSKMVFFGGITAAERNVVYTSTASKITTAQAGMTFKGATVLTNYEYDSVKTATLGTGTTYNNEPGVKVTFIDNNGDGAAEFISRYVTDLYTVSDVNATAKKCKLEGDDYDFEDIIDAAGSPVTVKNGDEILAAVYGGKAHVAQMSKITGKVTAISTSGAVTIDGTPYSKQVNNEISVSLGTEYDFYLDEYGYLVWNDTVSSTSAPAQFAYIKEVGEYSLYTGGVAAKLVFTNGTSQIVVVSEYDGHDANDVNKPDEGRIAEYTVNDDGSYVLELVDDNATTTWAGLTKGSPLIDAIDTDSDGKVDNLFTDAATIYIDMENGAVYVGYANVPSMTFDAADVNFLTNLDVTGSGSDNYVRYVFIADSTPATSTTSGVNYFLIPDVEEYTETKVGTMTVRIFDAFVDGVLTEITIDAADVADYDSTTDGNQALASMTLYKTTTYNSNGVVTALALQNALTSGDEVKYVSSSALVVGDSYTTYIVNASTKFIDLEDADGNVSAATTTAKDETVYVIADKGVALQVYELAND